MAKKHTNLTRVESITGRDNYIMCKALAYAIVTIDRLPERWQEQSDQSDMKALLEALTTAPDMYLIRARSHIECRGLKVTMDGQLDVADRPDPEIVKFPDPTPGNDKPTD